MDKKHTKLIFIQRNKRFSISESENKKKNRLIMFVFCIESIALHCANRKFTTKKLVEIQSNHRNRMIHDKFAQSK